MMLKKKSINILFYGASVTEQGGSEGYLDCLINREEVSEFTFKKITFPGGNLNDAGFFGLLEISKISQSFDCIFFEFATNWEASYSKHKLKIIFDYLKSLNWVVVFLILPKTNNWKTARESEALLEEYCLKYGFIFLDLRFDCYIYSLPDLLRDEVHTNEFGAQLFASKISDFLHSKKFLVSLEALNPLTNFRVYDNLNISLIEGDILRFKFLELGDFPEVAMKHTVGFHSGLINIKSDGVILEKNYLDYWCHYEREKFDILFNSEEVKSFGSEVFLSISNSPPDYSVLKFLPVDQILPARALRMISLYTHDCEIEIN